jgi:glycosyltransferase involved in cell wall biosynthesis
MRVLMVVRPAAGGMKTHVLALAQGLTGRGHTVEIAAPDASDLAVCAQADGFAVHAVPIAGPLHPIDDSWAVAALRGIVRGGEFEIVHAHGFKAGFVGRIGNAVAGSRPFVVTAHNHVLRRDATPRSAKWRYRVVERALTRYVTRYIAVSDSIRAELVEDYGIAADRVTTVRNGVAPGPFLVPQDRTACRAAIGVPLEAPALGLAARFSTQKGLRHLVAALADVRRAVPGALLLLGGSGPLESELREQAAAMEVSSAIRWLGHVDDIPAFLATLDVYVSPSDTEALGLGLIEAALAGVPTVATNVGGVSEVVLADKTGLLVQPADPPALAHAVVRLLEDHELARVLAAAARVRCLAEFDPEHMVDGTIAVYASALRSAACGQQART